MLLTYWYRSIARTAAALAGGLGSQALRSPAVLRRGVRRARRPRTPGTTTSRIERSLPSFGPKRLDRPQNRPGAPCSSAAELDFNRFRAVEDSGSAPWDLPEHDRRSAWVGEGSRGEALRVDLATLGPHPVFFRLSAVDPDLPIGAPQPSAAKELPGAGKTPIPAGQELLLITFFLLMATALVLAYRHLRAGRADRRGAGVLGTSVRRDLAAGPALRRSPSPERRGPLPDARDSRSLCFSRCRGSPGVFGPRAGHPPTGAGGPGDLHSPAGRPLARSPRGSRPAGGPSSGDRGGGGLRRDQLLLGPHRGAPGDLRRRRQAGQA